MPGKEFKTPRYAEPLIRVLPPFGVRTMPREYVVWGLYGALLEIYEKLGFSMCHFTLLWDDVEVGGLGFGDPFGERASEKRGLEEEELPEDIAENSITSAGMASRANPPTLNMTLTELASRLTTTFTPFSRPIDREILFVSMAWTVTQAAIPPSAQRIPHLWSPPDQESPARFSISATKRENPPWLQFFWVVEALARAADWVVEMAEERDEYRQFRGVLRVDGVEFGRGLWFWRG